MYFSKWCHIFKTAKMSSQIGTIINSISPITISRIVLITEYEKIGIYNSADFNGHCCCFKCKTIHCYTYSELFHLVSCNDYLQSTVVSVIEIFYFASYSHTSVCLRLAFCGMPGMWTDGHADVTMHTDMHADSTFNIYAVSQKNFSPLNSL